MSSTARQQGASSLWDAVRDGNTLALARAITEIENGTVAGVDLGIAAQESGKAIHTLGVTGPPGAGKSSLINAVISELLAYYPRIGVLTVDPSSPVSGGAVLGDRVRMAAHTANRNVFIRSLAARGHLGGVTRATRIVLDLLAASGMNLAIVETVGTGQSEVEVAAITDLKILVCAPGMGDEMQAIKAGILEVVDILVVNKADLPDADRTANFLKSMLLHRGHDERRLAMKVSALKREGLSGLAEAIRVRLGQTQSEGKGGRTVGDARSMLCRDAADLLTAALRQASSPEVEALLQRTLEGAITRREAAREALQLVAQNSGSLEAASASSPNRN